MFLQQDPAGWAVNQGADLGTQSGNGVLIVLVVMYFIPTLIAALRMHYNLGAVLACNLLLGWTFIGWVVAFVWAVKREPKHVSQEAFHGRFKQGGFVTGDDDPSHKEGWTQIKATDAGGDLVVYGEGKNQVLGIVKSQVPEQEPDALDYIVNGWRKFKGLEDQVRARRERKKASK